MSNNLSSLNDILFGQLDRLNTVSGGENMQKEIERSKAVSQIARDIISNSKLALEVAQHKADFPLQANKLPTMLTNGAQK